MKKKEVSIRHSSRKVVGALGIEAALRRSWPERSTLTLSTPL
jgi:hypothetical protein